MVALGLWILGVYSGGRGWLRLGIHLERTTPGHPEQNGRHERMHLTLKQEATRPAATNVLQQQARFDTLQPQAAASAARQATPASCYTPSTRLYGGLEELDYRCTTGPR